MTHAWHFCSGVDDIFFTISRESSTERDWLLPVAVWASSWWGRGRCAGRWEGRRLLNNERALAAGLVISHHSIGRRGKPRLDTLQAIALHLRILLDEGLWHNDWSQYVPFWWSDWPISTYSSECWFLLSRALLDLSPITYARRDTFWRRGVHRQT